MWSRRWPVVALVLVALLASQSAGGQELIFADGFESGSTCRWSGSVPAVVCEPAVVFVSRQIPPEGSIYWSVPNDMPGVGVYSRFRVAAPGKLLVREPDGSLRTLIDGSDPRPETFELIDVNAPDVSWDGGEIVFAGLPDGSHPSGPVHNPGAWRLFAIGADGTGLRQVTFSDQVLDLSQFGAAAGPLAPSTPTRPGCRTGGSSSPPLAGRRWRSTAACAPPTSTWWTPTVRTSTASPPSATAPTGRWSILRPAGWSTPAGGATTASPPTAPPLCRIRTAAGGSRTA